MLKKAPGLVKYLLHTPEPCSTLQALESFVGGGGVLGQLVFDQPGLLVGAVVAIGALVGPEGLPVLILHVGCQAAILEEPFVAEVAGVWPLPRVLVEHVVGQIVGDSAAVVAEVTLDRLLLFMHNLCR